MVIILLYIFVFVYLYPYVHLHLQCNFYLQIKTVRFGSENIFL